MFAYGWAGSGKGRRAIGRPAAILCAVFATPASAAPATASGTTIVNTASLSIGADDARVTIASNTVMLRVDATIDVAVAAFAETLAASPASNAVAFVVTNGGNARETFTLAATAGATIAVDDDGDGAYDPAHDRSTTAALDAGAHRIVFAIVPGPLAGTVRVALTATASTGHGAPGTVFAAAGADGIDAVVGATGGAATAETILTVDATLPTLVKSQSVLAPDGSARVMPGATITYQLDASFAGPTREASIADDLPAGTTFVPGSITLDGTAMTDAADDDAASFDGAVVRVALGDVAGPTKRTVRFRTRIN